MIIVLQVAVPDEMAQAVKETVAMAAERYGKTNVLEIRPEKTEKIEQMRMEV